MCFMFSLTRLQNIKLKSDSHIDHIDIDIDIAIDIDMIEIDRYIDMFFPLYVCNVYIYIFFFTCERSS